MTIVYDKLMALDIPAAEQAYSANLNVAATTRGMLNKTLDLLK